MSGNSNGSTLEARNHKKMRILMLCPKGSLDAGGMVSHFELTKYLEDYGCETKTITSWHDDYNETLSKIGYMNASVNYNWWAPRDLPKNISLTSIEAIKTITEEIENFSPQLVITNTSHIPWGALAASMKNIPHIWVVREFPINNFEYLKEKVPFIIKYSNKIAANSAELAQFYQSSYSVNASAFMSYVEHTNLNLGPMNNKVKLVSPNYISKTKNQVDLLNAVSILRGRRRDFDLQVVLMGEKDKAYALEFENYLNKLDLQEIVTVHSRVDKPWLMVSASDIVIQTSTSESIGRTTTEAMKLGLAVIASDIPGHREAFSLGDGVLYELGNANDLASKIENLLDNPDKKRKLGENAKSRALKNMSRDACNKPVIEAIEAVIDQDNPVGANQIIWPYLSEYISQSKDIIDDQTRLIQKKNQETDSLFKALEEVRESRAYRLGRAQTKVIRKLFSVVKGNK